MTDGETVETVSDFILGGSKITADGNCSHEIKRRLLLGSPAEGEGHEGFPPPPDKDLESPSSTRLEALVPSRVPRPTWGVAREPLL